MAKRFIDTDIWKDEWFSELSRDAKMFFIYYITSCDHAGFLKVNRKLIAFQTDIPVNSIDTVIKEFGNRMLRVSEAVIFYPNFIEFQYPKGLSENSKPQKAVMDLLEKNGIEYQKLKTVSKELTNSYVTVQDKDKDKEKDLDKENKKAWFQIFWDKYAKKQDSKKCLDKWMKLSEAEMNAALDKVDAYVASTPDVQFRKNPLTWLNGKCWNDEIILPSKPQTKFEQSAKADLQSMLRYD